MDKTFLSRTVIPDWKVTTFEIETPYPTYAIGFYAVHKKYSKKVSADNENLAVYGIARDTPELLDAVELLDEVVYYFEDVLGKELPTEKMDAVFVESVPDEGYGTGEEPMGTPGLCFIYLPIHLNVAVRTNALALILSRCVAKTYFLNNFEVKSWADVWMAEGMASLNQHYAAYYANLEGTYDRGIPWEIDKAIVRDRNGGKMDALAKPIQNDNFDYDYLSSKSLAIHYMYRSIVGPQKYVEFLKDIVASDPVDQTTLWSKMQSKVDPSIVKKDIKEILSPYTSETKVPIVRLKKSSGVKQTTITGDDNFIVPVFHSTWIGDSMSEPKMVILDKKEELPMTWGEHEVFFVNARGEGYFIPMYDDEHMLAIGDVLKAVPSTAKSTFFLALSHDDNVDRTRGTDMLEKCEPQTYAVPDRWVWRAIFRLNEGNKLKEDVFRKLVNEARETADEKKTQSLFPGEYDSLIHDIKHPPMKYPPPDGGGSSTTEPAGDDLSTTEPETTAGDDLSTTESETTAGDDLSTTESETTAGDDLSTTESETTAGDDFSTTESETTAGDDLSTTESETTAGDDLSTTESETENEESSPGTVEEPPKEDTRNEEGRKARLRALLEEIWKM
ncbi:unnamed protein product [Cyprideis torosa]|uniref:Uncharacterized protein n=1 Tax=Cyprideis torosa TaxID=163714 RepID=A0A7R8W9V5_9CRUS|nr:unnamed protein product [Cyprideis torosa]CAG0890185.1 unnamed protein product [Cyprideis torosa]